MNQTLRIVVAALRKSLGVTLASPTARSVSGGCINQSSILADSATGQSWFVKTHSADRLEAFRAEQAGLEELRASGTIRVPEPLFVGESDNSAYLVMEAIDFDLPHDRTLAETRLGKQLAALHSVEGERFGWNRDNRIGDTPQVNDWTDDWISFYREHRLGYQWQLAQSKGLHLPEMPGLLDALPSFFVCYQPAPALLHGDLWSGNVGYDEQAQPVFFDPAVYFGDRETDLAFTEMFGGFGADFYQAYDAALPRHPGYSKRRELYNLYHLLNHFNLFGGGYGESARNVTNALIRSVD